MALYDCEILTRWRAEPKLDQIHVLFENVVWETTGREFELCCAFSQKEMQAQSRKSPSVSFGLINGQYVHILSFQTRPCEIQLQQTA